MPKWHNPWHPDDPVRFSPVKRQMILDFPWSEVSDETHKLLEQGRMMMICPYCGTESIAGPWCWKCYRMVRPEHWQRATSVTADGKRRRGRPPKNGVQNANT